MNDFYRCKIYTNIVKKVGYTIKKYKLIELNDNILVGVSGGKDSLFLLEALADRIKHLPFRVNIIACHIHVNEVGYKIDRAFLDNLCKNLNIPLIVDNISVDLTVNTAKSPCFVCSWHRRKRLFEIAKENNCNKLALGHHSDDAIETLIMNMVFHGSISSMPAKLKMFDGRMHLIRPLIELTNADIAKMSEIRQYSLLESNCHYADNTQRSKTKEIVTLMNATNKNARKNILNSMDKILIEYLPNGFDLVNSTKNKPIS